MITVNNRSYQSRSKPVIGICMDGTSQEYFDAALDIMPNLQKILKKGSRGLVNSVIPSFTNPNNMALTTGVTPDINGVSGNYYYDTELNQEVLMNDPKYLKAPTILSAFSESNKSVAVVTTKDKLRQFLSKGLKNGICFSVEFAEKATEAEHGIKDIQNLVGRKNPGIYDSEASVFCIEAGACLMKRKRFDLMYLSTTDYVQHKYAPNEKEAREFYARIDRFFGELDAQDVILGITADHGMSAKTKSDGSPQVEFLETILKDKGVAEARVILPITDPYVVHHGALGSFATVYVNNANISKASDILRGIPGVELVLTRDEAAKRYSLPPQQIGELVVLADKHTVLGRTREWHDLSSVGKGLRSHGGLHESVVPMIINRPLKPEFQERLKSGKAKNYDLYDFLLNGTLE
jgi:phosphonoacetate hydrolase